MEDKCLADESSPSNCSLVLSTPREVFFSSRVFLVEVSPFLITTIVACFLHIGAWKDSLLID